MSNDYLPFAYEADANVLSQEDWAALPDRPVGFKRGTAISKNFNKAWRQCSVVMAALAQFIDANTPGDLLDDGDVNALASLLATAITAVAGGVVMSETAPASPGQGQLWFDPVTTQLFVRYGDAWVIAVNPGMDGGHYP